MSGPWGRREHGIFEELGEVAKVDEGQRARGSTTTDKGS